MSIQKHADTLSPRARFLAICEAAGSRVFHARGGGDSFSVYLPGLYRQFAAWFDGGPQPGAHLRSEGSVHPTSTSFRGGHNWVHVADIDWNALPAAVEESRRIASMRGAGRPDSGGVYKPLATALKALTSPPTGLHAGGPPAKPLGSEQELAMALCARCMERMRDFTLPGDEATLARLKGLLGKAVKYEILWPAANALPYGTESAKRAADEAESPAVQMVRALLGCNYGSQKCLPFVTKALVRAVREVQEREGPAKAAELVVELDELIMREEVVAVLRTRTKTKSPDIERVLWRGADAKRFPAWWIVRIAPNTYGFLGKLGSRWGWHVGDWDATLALLPDELFEMAVEVATTRDGRA